MSHLKERKEQICLNCQSPLHGRYCHLCGQENLEPKETVWHLITHFFNDITHFDGKFFSSVKYLVRKPGFLSREYMLGRRASYLNPIRMYVFTSAIFFIILFSISSPDKIMNVHETPEVKKGLPALIKDRDRLQKYAISKNEDADDRVDDSVNAGRLALEIALIKKEYGDTTTKTFTKSDRSLLLARAELDSSLRIEGVSPGIADKVKKAMRTDKSNDDISFFGLNAGRYKSVEQYDSAEKALPDSLRDGWFTHMMVKRGIAVNEEYHRDKKGYFNHFMESFFHSFPKVLFFSLPFFALILNMVYFRHKQYYYVDHGIFTIHLYCANFILILAMVLLNKLAGIIGWRGLEIFVDVLNFGLFIYMLVYLYKAMRGFYQQRRAKTMLKYFIVCSLAFLVNLILLVIAVMISAISLY